MAISLQKKETNPHKIKGHHFFSSLKKVNLQDSFQAKVSTDDVMFFTSQFSMMLETGIPINTSIRTISDQVKHPQFKKILIEVVGQIEEGVTLFVALSKYPQIFPQVYISMVRAGEAGGNLREMLDQQVAFQKKRDEILSTLKSAMAYPIFLVFISVSVILFILTFVFPKFEDLFDQIGSQLPASTQVLVFLSHFLRDHFTAVLIGIGGLGGIAWKSLSSQKGKAAFGRLILSLPIIKEFVAKFYISQFMRTLGVLIGSGVLLMEAITVCKGVVANSVFGRFMDHLLESVEGGKGLAKPMEEAPFLPNMVKQMIRTGEETGNLPKAMARIADYYDQELSRNVKTLSAVLEPIFLTLMGLVVGVVVISLVLPIFKLTQAVR